MRDDDLASKFPSHRQGFREVRARISIVAMSEGYRPQIVQAVTNGVSIAEISEDRYRLVEKHLRGRIVFFHARQISKPVERGGDREFVVQFAADQQCLLDVLARRSEIPLEIRGCSQAPGRERQLMQVAR